MEEKTQKREALQFFSFRLPVVQKIKFYLEDALRAYYHHDYDERMRERRALKEI